MQANDEPHHRRAAAAGLSARRPRAAFGLALRLALALAAAWLLLHAARAQPVTAPGEAIKAAYLMRFIGYVEWPPSAFASPDSPLVIGVAGAEGVLWQVAALARDHGGDGRPTVVRGIVPGDPLEGVHLLFVGAETILPRGWLESARGNAVLVVTDSPRGLADGAVLNFVMLDRRIRFEASIPAAEDAGLKLSSRLLAVASRVVTQR